ncbi:MAG: MarR family transcriptional regulator [Jatrophihabitans sp.]|nr:MAG: MarR family transcriptional regulator [Jatrophihabitans sp.]
MPGPPVETPVGLLLAGTAKAVSRAFDDALVAAGGSLPVWLILISLVSRRPATQRELAEAVGIRGATLTHHLVAMEADGLVTRRREPGNRRVQVVELTTEGRAAFTAMRGAAIAFDRRLRHGLGEADLHALRDLLARLAANVAPTRAAQPPRRGADSC